MVYAFSGRRLLHRQTAQATVVGASPDTLLVPRSAVLQHSGRPVVYVAEGEQAGGRAFRAREVRLGRVGDRDAEVLAGLAQGDRVVTQAALILDSQAQLAHAAVSGGGHDHGDPVPTKVAAGTAPHDEAAYGLLRALVFAAADAAAYLAADDLDGYRKVLPALRAALAAYLAGYAPAARGSLAPFAGKLADGPDLDGGELPADRESLEALPGVGRKTANVILNTERSASRPWRWTRTSSAWPTARDSRPARPCERSRSSSSRGCRRNS